MPESPLPQPIPARETAPDPMPSYTHGQVLRVVTGIMLCILLASLDQTVIIPAVPAIADELNAFGHLSWIVTAYLLTSTAATPIYGKLSDIYGRRAMMLPAIAIFIVASLACGFAQSLPQLILARALQGLGGGGLFAMAQAAIADVVAPRERGRYQGYMASMWAVSSIAGPIVGGWATDHLSWRWVFWINLPLGLVAMLLCNRALKLIRHRRRPAQIDWARAILLVSAVTAWLLLLTWAGTEFAWLSPEIMGLAALGCVLLGLLVWQERRARDPILPPRLFGNWLFLCGVTIAFCTSLGLFGATFLLPVFFQLLLGVDASTSGVLVMPFLASGVIGAVTAGQTARRLGRVKSILLCGLAVTLGCFLALSTMDGGTSLWVTIPVTFLLGMGTGLTMPTVLVQVQNAAEWRDVGAATGSMLFLRSMGGAFGSTVVGTVLTMRFGAGLVTAGLDGSVDLGALRHGGGGLSTLGADALGPAQAALTSGFQLGFGLCAAVTAVALAVASWMRDVPLRSAPTPRDLAHRPGVLHNVPLTLRGRCAAPCCYGRGVNGSTSWRGTSDATGVRTP